ncbi:4Fe-4S dicluster domain-containing protein [Candidatus Desantisbacteria bacterium]|nr:4Fe-4S dicluster domain-containing protein [Candidatus Desantisbacteria bacterium]
MEYTITTDNLKSLINDLSKEHIVYAPKQVSADTILYEQVASFDEYDSTALMTNTSAKAKIYPQCDKLFEFALAADGIALKENKGARESIIFGCRPCDAKGFSLLDNLFDWKGYRDESYFARRDKTTIISISCTTPQSTCFCNSFKDGGATSKIGSDLLLTPIVDESSRLVLNTPISDKYLVEVVTEKGKKIIEGGRYFEPATERDTAIKQDLEQSVAELMPNKLKLDEIKKTLDTAFESPYWDTVHLPCLKCNVCTFVCPTCYCFDISECPSEYSDGERNRTWDSCMSETFTKMAGGVNPRTDSKRRFRQRVMHKFRYHMDNFNEYLCTGCGRCIKYCPVGMDIRKVLEGQTI